MFIKNKNQLLGVVLVGFFIGCTQNKTENKTTVNKGSTGTGKPVSGVADTLTYVYEKAFSQSIQMNQKKQPDTAIAAIKYPVFNSADALNDSVKAFTNANINPDEPVLNNPQQTVNRFINNFKNDRKKFPEVIPYELKIDINVSNQTNEFVSLKSTYLTYVGGAHHSYGTFFKNYSRKASLIQLNDLVKSETELEQIGESIFRKLENLPEKSDFKGYFFAGGKFKLNNNFTITKDGLLFIYNPYEIKPFSEGQTQLLIPNSALKPILKPGNLLSNFINE